MQQRIAAGFLRADHVVKFRIEAELNYSIEPLTGKHLPVYADVIRKSFTTVANSFSWTKEIAPTFTAYISDENCMQTHGLILTFDLILRMRMSWMAFVSL